jgi:integrase
MKNSPYWWMKWIGVDGRAQYESSKTNDHATAKTMLKQREGKIADGEPVTSAIGRLKFKDAAADLETDFTTNGRKSADEVERRLRLHILPFFGRCRMVDITTPLIRKFIAQRQADTIVVQKARTIRHPDGHREHLPEITKPVSPAEINRELQLLKRCFNLARKEGRLLHTPYVPMLRENNVRQGFIDRDQLHSVLAFLPTELQPVVQFAFLTEWRMASELLPLEWSRVDFEVGEVRLDPGTTKNGEGRTFPMNADLRALLKTQQAAHDRLKKQGLICPRVFVRMVAEERGGKKKPQPICSVAKSWSAACTAAGLPGRILHDLRRSAIRNMVRAGVPERVAMTHRP